MSEQIAPKVAWLTVNRACNFRCGWCYAQGTDYSIDDSMSLELAKKLTMLMSNIGINHLFLIGGEPTLWKPLIDFNRFCNEVGMKTTIVTNAMRFGVNNFWEEYKENPNTSVGISLKAYDSETLKKNIGVSNSKIVLLGIKRGIEFFRCGVSTVYNSLYLDNLLDMAKFAMGCGARSLSIGFCTPIVTRTQADSQFMIDPTLLIPSVIKDYRKLSEITSGHLGFSMKLPLCLWPKDFIEMLIQKNQITTVCQLQQRTGVIFDVDGSLIACNGLYDYPIGKYKEDFSNRKEILNFLSSRKVINFYDQINTYPSEKCISCKMYTYCAGGCNLLWTVYNAKQMIKGW